MSPIVQDKAPDEAQSGAFTNLEAGLEEETSPRSVLWRLFDNKNSIRKPLPPIPQTSIERQHAAVHDHALNVSALLQDDQRKEHSLKQKTVLYLGYGSNMSSQTLRKTRGITPLSQINVCVPDLCLTFDLPGVPYLEPCFAATQYRDPATGRPRYPNGRLASDADRQHKHEDEDEEEHTLLPPHHSTADETTTWRKPLVGVVYEVTLSDYAHIIATEGGGASYQDIAVDCYPFPAPYDPSHPVPDHPTTTPFRAHTLLSPTHQHSSTQPNGDTTPRKSHRIRDPTYAQPSPRYKSLLVTGAHEHDLPTSYRAYLSSIQAYYVTTRRQRVGQVLVQTLWLPLLLFSIVLSALFADERGKAPRWLVRVQKGLFEGIWWSYDVVLRKVFGDGERTIGT
ncbi:hypothetical protein PRK78_006868 [Emydomyces testavorans]|uniref:gamma-glutamylcyclotransferase n=1 Tax=Emydomyces testavorans TaxID=2070801 RepID=A0AAF0IL63_9EURO|nr:hypothetical protein PRK78_006868 [Emydomyces testavorans]